MNFDGDYIRVTQEQTWRDGAAEEGALVSASDVCSRQRVVRHWAIGHIAAEDFDAVQVNDAAIIAHQTNRKVCECRAIRQYEGVPKVSRGIASPHRPDVDDR